MSAAVTFIGDSNSEGSETSTSTSITIGAGVVPPAGSSVLMLWRGGEGGSSHTASDSVPNTYAQEVLANQHPSANLETILFSSHAITALEASDVITSSWTTNVGARTTFAIFVTGLAATPFVDHSLTNTPEGTTHDSGNVTLPAGTYFLLGTLTDNVTGGTDPGALAVPALWTEIHNEAGEALLAWREVTITEETQFSFAPTTVNAAFCTSIIAAYSVAAAAGDIVLFRRRIEGY